MFITRTVALTYRCDARTFLYRPQNECRCEPLQLHVAYLYTQTTQCWTENNNFGCSASYVRWQRGTARICRCTPCCGRMLLQSIDNRLISPNRREHSSKPIQSNVNKRAQVFLFARIFYNITYKLKHIRFQLTRNENCKEHLGQASVCLDDFWKYWAYRHQPLNLVNCSIYLQPVNKNKIGLHFSAIYTRRKDAAAGEWNR